MLPDPLRRRRINLPARNGRDLIVTDPNHGVAAFSAPRSYLEFETTLLGLFLQLPNELTSLARHWRDLLGRRFMAIISSCLLLSVPRTSRGTGPVCRTKMSALQGPAARAQSGSLAANIPLRVSCDRFGSISAKFLG